MSAPMDKRSLAVLEKAFNLEVYAAISGGFDVMQTKSKLAEKLVEGGFLITAQQTIRGAFPVTINGYRLTHLGRLTYCATCKDTK